MATESKATDESGSPAPPQPGPAGIETILVTGISNRDFLERYAAAGCIGLSGGVTLIDQAINRAERHLDPAGRWGSWSHAFVLQGRRLDGQHWVMESDLQIHHKHVQLGVQENRLAKYHDEDFYTSLAVLDFGLSAAQLDGLLREGLDLVANRTRYSVRELAGTLLALRDPRLRARENVLARDQAMYCSAFVQHLYRKIGLDLNPGIHGKNTTPEDLARTAVAHRRFVLQREVAPGKLARLRTRLRRKVRAGLARLQPAKPKS